MPDLCIVQNALLAAQHCSLAPTLHIHNKCLRWCHHALDTFSVKGPLREPWKALCSKVTPNRSLSRKSFICTVFSWAVLQGLRCAAPHKTWLRYYTLFSTCWCHFLCTYVNWIFFFFQIQIHVLSLCKNVQFQKNLSLFKHGQTKITEASLLCCSVNINATTLATITALHSRGVRSPNCTVSPPRGNCCGVLFHPYVFPFRPLQEGTLTCQPVLLEQSWGCLSLIRVNIRLGLGAFSMSTFVLPVLFHSVTAAPLCLTLLRNRPFSCPLSPTPRYPSLPPSLAADLVSSCFTCLHTVSTCVCAVCWEHSVLIKH